MMDEFSFINNIKQKSYKQSTLIKGIGDDAAVFRQTAKDIVTAVDTFVEGIHFTKKTMESYHIGYRALAANISDLAAMGANPAYYLVSIVIPKSWSQQELKQIFLGMDEIAKNYKMDLIGGDTVSGNDLILSITVIGFVDRHIRRLRNAAMVNDIVFVTGTLGDSQAGLHIINNSGQYIDEDYFIDRHRMPSPRVNFVNELGLIKRIALNDISDGIANEAAEIAEASNVTINIYEHCLPTHRSLAQFSEQCQYNWKLFGGEDFELIGTVAMNEWPTIKAAAVKANLQVSKIGFVSPKEHENDFVFLHANGKKEKLDKQGYVHLR